MASVPAIVFCLLNSFILSNAQNTTATTESTTSTSLVTTTTAKPTTTAAATNPPPGNEDNMTNESTVSTTSFSTTVLTTTTVTEEMFTVSFQATFTLNGTEDEVKALVKKATVKKAFKDGFCTAANIPMNVCKDAVEVFFKISQSRRLRGFVASGVAVDDDDEDAPYRQLQSATTTLTVTFRITLPVSSPMTKAKLRKFNTDSQADPQIFIDELKNQMMTLPGDDSTFMISDLTVQTMYDGTQAPPDNSTNSTTAAPGVTGGAHQTKALSCGPLLALAATFFASVSA